MSTTAHEPGVPVGVDTFGGSGRFRDAVFVGKGSMGSVYRVYDGELETTVALKTLRNLVPEQVYRLKREFRSLTGVVHRNLAHLYELVVNDESCFFTMEFIDGVDFVEYVRGGSSETAGEARLPRFLEAARQLVRGLAAIHAASRLHRDVKPSNVQVTRDGRVVLLDFDLVAAVGDTEVQDSAAGVAGTLAYMAPEQAWGRSLSPAADWYAAGALFYEALTGELPFHGPAARVLTAKAESPPPSLRTIDAAIPEGLDRLILRLLSPDPAARPGPNEILAQLDFDAEQPQRPPIRTSPAQETPFIGRSSEMAQLRALFDVAAGQRAVVASVRGVSGIGKTELLRRFVSELERDQGAVVLSGRCHPQEAVPYKALDPVIDALSRLLLGMSEASVQALLPRNSSALARLFPVLARVRGISLPRREERGTDFVEVRRRGFGALRELLGRLAEAHRLVVWIDDLQWGDFDSAALVGNVLRPPDAPPMLWVLSYRSEEDRNMPLLDVVRDISRGAAKPLLEEIEIGPLDPVEAERLAFQLCHAREHSVAIAAEAGGSPFLISELARQVARGQSAIVASGGAELGRVIEEHLQDLPPPARHILELVSVAGGPISRGAVLDAARYGGAGRPLVSMLQDECLIRDATVGDQAGVETYHDRIREAVVEQLSSPTLSERHRELAVTLEAGRAEPEVLARHFHGAGLATKAADYAVAAADRAADALAFDRAADMYGAAREWDPRDPAWTRFLLTREADARVNAARFLDGAKLYLSAAEGASRVDALELRRRASEQLLAGGGMDEGVAELSRLLGDLGLEYPRTPGRALFQLLARLLRLMVRGIRPSASESQADAVEMIRIDTCYSAAKALVDIDSVRGVCFSLQSLDRALKAGDRQRLGLCLCIVGGSIAVIGSGPIARLGARMMELAEQIAEETQSPALLGTIAVSRGQGLMLAGRWKEALARCDTGVRLLSERCRGFAYECNIARGMAERALEELGDFDELLRRAREQMDHAAASSNRYEEVAASQHLSFARLAYDDIEGARALARRGLELWKQDGFHLQHLYSLRAEGLCDLYENEPAASYDRLDEMWPAMRRSQLLRVPLARIDALSLRARLALSRVAREGERGDLLRACRRDVRQLEREKRPDATVYARLLGAGLAAGNGERADAVAQLDEAARIAEQADMPLHAACAALRRGELIEGPEGRRLVEEARARIRESGSTNPDRWVNLYAPGFRTT